MERLTRRELWLGSQGKTDKAVDYKVDEKRRCVTHEGSPDFLIADKLAEYEDLEEQGKLMKLPCAVGDVVYYADNEYYFTVLSVKVDEISIMESNAILYKCLLFDGNGDVETQFDFDKDDFGKTVFLTRQEAEDKLAEMEGKNGYTD